MVTFRHHSRLLSYRRPQGALKTGETVTIRAELSSDEQVEVFLRVYEQDGDISLLTMRADGGWLSASYTAPETPCLVWYYFVLKRADGSTLCYGAESGEGSLVSYEPTAYQITVYDGAFTTPRRFCEGVAYQIFPDRFRRSSWEDFYGRANAHIARGRHPRLHDRWSEPVCYRATAGEADYTPNDFYGGDFNGIREKLPYLADLGVTILYLNPIVESESNHRYNTADYRVPDPFLGTVDELRALVGAAKEYGIEIMLDGVFSHTGDDSRYFDRYHRYDDVGAYESVDSPYYPWYSFSRYPDSYACWWGFPTLPNVNETEPSYLRFITGEGGVLDRWAELGLTSWRLDVADELPEAFLKALYRCVKRNNPEALVLGEVWDDASNKYGPEGRRDYVSGDELDSTMSYPFTNAVTDFFTLRDDAIRFAYRLAVLREHYPKPFYDASWNLLSSHDVVRAATGLSGAPDRRSMTREAQAHYTPTPENAEKGRKRLILATAIQMLLPGIPCVYYGDEAGMTGMGDPFNRGTYPWGNEDRALIEVFRTLIGVRRGHTAVKSGLTRMGALSPDVFAIVRYDESETVVLLVNRADTERTVLFDAYFLNEGADGETPLVKAGALTETRCGEKLKPTGGDTVTVPPLDYKLYIG